MNDSSFIDRLHERVHKAAGKARADADLATAARPPVSEHDLVTAPLPDPACPSVTPMTDDPPVVDARVPQSLDDRRAKGRRQLATLRAVVTERSMPMVAMQERIIDLIEDAIINGMHPRRAANAAHEVTAAALEIVDFE